MKLVARILSTILHPLLMPIYGIILILNYSYLLLLPIKLKILIIGIVALFTLLVPFSSIIILYSLKVIGSVTLNNRSDRKWPYLISIISYLVGTLFLYKINVPLWLIGFMGGGILALLISTIITYWWKISAHMTGIAGLLGAAYYLMVHFQLLPLSLFMILILLVGFLGSARIALNRHTLGQVMAGIANGFCCVYLIMLLL